MFGAEQGLNAPTSAGRDGVKAMCSLEGNAGPQREMPPGEPCSSAGRTDKGGI